MQPSRIEERFQLHPLRSWFHFTNGKWNTFDVHWSYYCFLISCLVVESEIAFGFRRSTKKVDVTRMFAKIASYRLLNSPKVLRRPVYWLFQRS
jgi:hypothetical protein